VQSLKCAHGTVCGRTEPSVDEDPEPALQELDGATV
jgi:hypothetical protein